MAKYEAFVLTAAKCEPVLCSERTRETVLFLRTPSKVPVASLFSVQVPVVPPESIELYKRTVELPRKIFDSELTANISFTYRKFGYSLTLPGARLMC
ncbi:unnamed protein product [Soboliphyme baturini]|uniref:Uncharacterized protein n=1 Tax=Soboliphyme baturini TaxID=241478 RepID=A0A183ILS6_9BILA|nr:unnamed protein product [Soboliphyme baturini]